MALLHLFTLWQKESNWTGTARVAVVDHALRPDSAQEAIYVLKQAKQRGFSASCLRWVGKKPKQGLQEAARTARYALLFEEMHRHAIPLLLLAHHREDQVETMILRALRGSGVYGLQGMQSLSFREAEGVFLYRPFLHLSKTQLQARLCAENVTWCEDPSNMQEQFMRIRLRKLCTFCEENKIDLRHLAKLPGKFARVVEALEIWRKNLEETSVTQHPAGPCFFPLASLRAVPEEISLRFLAVLCCRISGKKHGPRLECLMRLRTTLFAAIGTCKRTLHGCVFYKKADRVYLYKERGRAAEGSPLLLQPGERALWDARFVIELESVASNPFSIVALRTVRRYLKGLRLPEGWPSAAFAEAPCCLRADEAHSLASLQGRGRVLALWKIPGIECPGAEKEGEGDFSLGISFRKIGWENWGSYGSCEGEEGGSARNEKG